MKSFNMKDTDIKHTISKIGWKLERDEQGRLFHPGMRAMFDPLKIELGAIEALSASIINKILHAPITKLRESSRAGSHRSWLEVVHELFGLGRRS